MQYSGQSMGLKIKAMGATNTQGERWICNYYGSPDDKLRFVVPMSYEGGLVYNTELITIEFVKRFNSDESRAWNLVCHGFTIANLSRDEMFVTLESDAVYKGLSND